MSYVDWPIPKSVVAICLCSSLLHSLIRDMFVHVRWGKKSEPNWCFAARLNDGVYCYVEQDNDYERGYLGVHLASTWRMLLDHTLPFWLKEGVLEAMSWTTLDRPSTARECLEET